MRKVLKCMLLLAVLAGAGSVRAQPITNPIVELKNHILGVSTLTAAQIVADGNTIQHE